MTSSIVRIMIIMTALTSVAAGQTTRPTQPIKIVPASAPAIDPNGPVYSCPQDTFDFGSVWSGVRVTHGFPVQNVGKTDLHIIEVKPTCGCTAVPNYPRVIAPGQSGTVQLVLDSGHKRDKTDVKVEVHTNEPGKPTHYLRFTGFVRTVAKFEPLGQQYFNSIPSDFKGQRQLTITNTSGSPLKLELQSLPIDSPFLGTLSESKPGQEYKLLIEARGPFKEGNTAVPFKFVTNIAEAPTWQIDVTAWVPPRVHVNPPKMLVDGNQRSDQQRPLHIMNNGTTQFEIVSIKGSKDFLAPKLVSSDGKRFQFQVTIPAFYRPTTEGEYVVVETTDPEKKLITVPILPYGAPPPPELVPPEYRNAAQAPVQPRLRARQQTAAQLSEPTTTAPSGSSR